VAKFCIILRTAILNSEKFIGILRFYH
jgi:hypothetical protein